MKLLTKLASLPTEILLLAVTLGVAAGLSEPDAVPPLPVKTAGEVTVAEMSLPAATAAVETPNQRPAGDAFVGPPEAPYAALSPWRSLAQTGDAAPPAAALPGRPRATRNLPSIPPVYGIITSGFGMRRSPFKRASAVAGRRAAARVFHAGVDIAAPRHALFVAPADGIVVAYERKSGYGALLTLDHGDGIETTYAHADVVIVAPGERVSRGQALGTVGVGGHSTGPHLHYEVWDRGDAIDPAPFLALPTRAELTRKLARQPATGRKRPVPAS